MARRRRKISVGDLSGGLALGLVLALVLGTLAAVTWRAEPGAGLGPASFAVFPLAMMIPVTPRVAGRDYSGSPWQDNGGRVSDTVIPPFFPVSGARAPG